MTEATVGERIFAARKAAGLSQRELAAQITAADRVDGLSPSALSRIESGQRRVASHELAELADVLGVNVEDLLGTRKRSAALVLAARVTQVSSAGLQQVADRARQVLEADDLLSRIVPPSAPLSMPAIFHDDVPVTKEGGRELAERARQALGLGDGPIGDLTALIEEHLGAHVLVEPLPSGVHGFCAVSPSAGGVPAAAVIIVNGEDLSARRRFTLAHELCHLLAGDPVDVEVLSSLADKTPAEHRADAFAANFLAPAEGVRRAVGPQRFDETLVRRLSRVFGMSHQAMTRRLEEVGSVRFLSSDHARDVALRAALLAGSEGETSSRRPPVRLLDRALRAYEEGRIGIGLVADILGEADTVALGERLYEQGHRPPAPAPDAWALA